MRLGALFIALLSASSMADDGTQTAYHLDIVSALFGFFEKSNRVNRAQVSQEQKTHCYLHMTPPGNCSNFMLS